MSDVIVEACGNHQGNIYLLKSMIEASAEFGANFFKIQTFFAEDLSKAWKQDHDRIKKLELKISDHKIMIEWCKELGLEPLTSVYDKKYLKELKAIGFKYVKLGSAQSLDEDLIAACMADFKVIISTGGTNETRIPCYRYDSVLHCVSNYPTHPDESNLSRMWKLKELFPYSKIGFSSHVNPMHPRWADPLKLTLACGFGPIEVHYTMRDRSETKDGVVSLDSIQLAELCRWSKMSVQKLVETSPNIGMFACPQSMSEIDTITKYRTRWEK